MELDLWIGWQSRGFLVIVSEAGGAASEEEILCSSNQMCHSVTMEETVYSHIYA